MTKYKPGFFDLWFAALALGIIYKVIIPALLHGII